MKQIIKYFSAIILIAFALLTMYLSGSIIFDLFEMRAKQGDYVPFVIWANFICSFLYLYASYGFIKSKQFTTNVLLIALIILAFTLIAFLFYTNSGGIHKEVTNKAIIFRMSITLIFTIVSYLTITKKNKLITGDK